MKVYNIEATDGEYRPFPPAPQAAPALGGADQNRPDLVIADGPLAPGKYRNTSEVGARRALYAAMNPPKSRRNTGHTPQTTSVRACGGGSPPALDAAVVAATMVALVGYLAWLFFG